MKLRCTVHIRAIVLTGHQVAVTIQVHIIQVRIIRVHTIQARQVLLRRHRQVRRPRHQGQVQHIQHPNPLRNTFSANAQSKVGHTALT